MSKLTEEELLAEIQKGLDDLEAGRCIPAEEVYEKLHKEMGI